MAIADAPWQVEAIRSESDRQMVVMHLLSDPLLLEKIKRAKDAHAAHDVLSVDEFFAGLLD